MTQPGQKSPQEAGGGGRTIQQKLQPGEFCFLTKMSSRRSRASGLRTEGPALVIPHPS